MTAPADPDATGIRVVYTDLDGTTVGPRGCFFRSEDGASTLVPAQALLALHAAGVALVLVSGRTRAQLAEAARVFGADGFVAEMGAVLGQPVVAARAAARPEVTVTELPLGLGWAQAVRSSLCGPGPAALAAVGGLELEHDLGAAGR